MSTTAINASLTAINAANTAAAQAAADDARRERCKITLATYEPKTASTAVQQDYAQCVLFLHPVNTSSDVAAAKAAVAVALVLFLIGAAIGVYHAWSEYDGIVIGTIRAIVYGFGAMAFGVLFATIGVGVMFVFSSIGVGVIFS
jgi:hypothetical protein